MNFTTTETSFQTVFATAIEFVLWSTYPATSVNEPKQAY